MDGRNGRNQECKYLGYLHRAYMCGKVCLMPLRIGGEGIDCFSSLDWMGFDSRLQIKKKIYLLNKSFKPSFSLGISVAP